MIDNLKPLLEKILHGTSCSQEEAFQAMNLIMDGHISPVLTSAFLVALRMKGETTDEITGFVRAMREHAVKISPRVPHLVDTCGTGGDGAHTFNVSTVAAFVVAGAGIAVAKHGNRAVSSKCGSADLLEALGVNIQMSPQATQKAIEEIGIGFMFAPLYHPAMKHVAPVRKELGIRTVFNILGPMTNPAGTKRQVIGVFRKDLASMMAAVLQNVGTEAAWIVHGEDGLDELSLSASSHVTVLQNGGLQEIYFKPQDYGFKLCNRDALLGGSLEEAVTTTRAILENREKGPKRDWVILNAAAAILVGGGAKTFEEAVRSAMQSLESGNAAAKLEALAKCQ